MNCFFPPIHRNHLISYKIRRIHRIPCKNLPKNLDLFRFCPLSTLCARQLQTACLYIENHYVKIWHVRLGGANNMHPLSGGGGGGGGQTEKIQPRLGYIKQHLELRGNEKHRWTWHKEKSANLLCNDTLTGP